MTKQTKATRFTNASGYVFDLALLPEGSQSFIVRVKEVGTPHWRTIATVTVKGTGFIGGNNLTGQEHNAVRLALINISALVPMGA